MPPRERCNTSRSARRNLESEAITLSRLTLLLLLLFVLAGSRQPVVSEDQIDQRRAQERLNGRWAADLEPSWTLLMTIKGAQI